VSLYFFYKTQGTVATHLRCGEIDSDSVVTICFPDPDGERILEIG